MAGKAPPGRPRKKLSKTISPEDSKLHLSTCPRGEAAFTCPNFMLADVALEALSLFRAPSPPQRR